MQPKIRPFIVLDLEATGLNLDKSQMVQVAAVLHDGINNDPFKMKKISFFIDQPIDYWEDVAKEMNQWIIDDIESFKDGGDSKYPVVSLEEAMSELSGLVDECKILIAEFNEGREIHTGTKVQVAGKNAAAYDIPILKNECLKNSIECPEFMHRSLDVGSMFFCKFGYNAPLGLINQFVTGDDSVSHDALDDCFYVIDGIISVIEG